jgi:hypothetical protein
VTTVLTAYSVAPTVIGTLAAFVTVEALLCLALLAWNLRGRS